MVGWTHWLIGNKYEWTLGDSEGQESLARCSSWGCKNSVMTEWLNSNKSEVNQKEINTIWYYLYRKNPTMSDKAHLVLSCMSPASSRTTVHYHLLPATLSALHCLVWTMFLLIALSQLLLIFLTLALLVTFLGKPSIASLTKTTLPF